MDAALRFVDWLEPLLRRESYLALLVERPEVQHRLLRLLGLARWPMQLPDAPPRRDRRAGRRAAAARPLRRAPSSSPTCEARHDAWQRSGEADEESLLDTLRHAHHAEVFRTLVRDVEGELTVEQVADDLSALADAMLDMHAALGLDAAASSAHREAPRFAVIAYGKLGGKELGYGSDLDVVFLYDDADEADKDRAQEVYGAFVRKLITWLTLRTAAGELFDIDTALRPNGNSGLLVTSIERLRALPARPRQQHRLDLGAPGASRGRASAPARPTWPALRSVRRGVLTAPRDAAALRERDPRDAREGARRAPGARPAASTSSTAPAA